MASSLAGAAARLAVRISANDTEFQRALARTARAVEAVGDRLSSVGSKWSLKLTAPLAAAGALALRTAGSFESGMNRIEALTGATAEQLAALSAQAQDLGRRTQYSASQAADAMGFLAMAGFKVDQILSAMPSTLQLAAAAQLDMARAADITTNILTGYGLQVGELGHANDVLVKAFTSANVDLNMLGEAFKYVGPIARGAGVQFEEAAAGIALLGNAGIQGSMAGTVLRGALSRLLNPTAEISRTLERLGVVTKDSSGNLLPLVEIIRRLEEAGAGAEEMMVLFGDRAGPGMTALVAQGSKALRDLTAQLRESGGTAQRVADAQMKGFAGGLEEFKSAVEGAWITLANSGPLKTAENTLRRLALVVVDLTDQWSALAPETQQAVLQFTALAAAIGPGMFAAGKLVSVMGTLLGLMNPVALGIAAVAGAVWAIRTNFLGMGDVAARVWQMIMDVATRVISVIDRAFRPWANLLIATFHSLGQTVAMVFDEYIKGPAIAAFRAIREWAEPVLSAVARGFELLGRLGEGAARAIREAFAEAGEGAEEEGATLGQRIAATIAENFGRDYVGEFAGFVVAGIDRARELITKAIGYLRSLGSEGAGAVDALAEAAVALGEIKDETEDLTNGGKRDLSELGGVIDGLGSSVARTFGDELKNGRMRFKRFAEAIAADLAMLAGRFLVFKALTSMFDITSGGIFGSSLLGFALPGGGGKAGGGRVYGGASGRVYTVGEYGPERLVMGAGQVGTVVPSGGGDSGAVAAAILGRLGPVPAPMSPEAAATHTWYRRLMSEMVQDYRGRGGRI